jgi:hypothetical protein
MTTPMAWASRVTIFDVQKSLPMSAKDPVYHDYFINAGTEVGLKSGAIVTVLRRIPLHDPIQNRSQGDLEISVAKLYIIHVQKNLAVARFHESFDRTYLPNLEYDGPMTGDHIDLSSMEMGPRKGKSSATNSTVPLKEEVEVASVAVQPLQRETASSVLSPNNQTTAVSRPILNNPIANKAAEPLIIQADLKSAIQ